MGSSGLLSFHPVELKVYRFIKKHGIILPGEHILLGVSGGPDSIAMVHILLNLRKLLDAKYSVLHVNHGIRPESFQEEEFVIRSMKELKVANVIVEHFDVLSLCKEKRLSIEMGARLCRHEALESTRKRIGAHKIALAHQANDQGEELILRLFRGASFEGLEGMRPLEEDRNIVRPLLSISRREILSYLQEKNIPYLKDPSNLSSDFQRNRVRLELLPLAEDIFKRPVVKILNRFADIAAKENDYWRKEIENHWRKICPEEGINKVTLAIDQFVLTPVALQRRLIRHVFYRFLGSCYGISYAQIEAARRLIIESQPGRSVRIRGLIWLKGKEYVIVEGIENLEIENRIEEFLPIPGIWTGTDCRAPFLVETRLYQYEKWRFEDIIKSLKKPFQNSEIQEYIALMDYDCVKEPIVLRNWHQGDRFQPLGMNGHSKKIQDYLTDLRIPKHLKNSILLIVDREKICWVVGYRLDDRVKVTPQTKKILEIKVKYFTKP
ncbi:MAG: tRNA lysidine(34) synthetase TilS [Syntrophobacterales bacterium]|nr:tRNA lysidine(34) synthetase TilS [Syntrophobacterales bacterium]